MLSSFTRLALTLLWQFINDVNFKNIDYHNCLLFVTIMVHGIFYDRTIVLLDKNMSIWHPL